MTTDNNTPTPDRFADIKEEILRRAREARACKKQYGRAYSSDDTPALMQVVKDNFAWACNHHVLTPDIIGTFREEFAANGIFLNEDAESAFVLACGNATVRACGNATVRAYGNATVEAHGNATVEAWGNATVEAHGNAYVTSYGTIECKLADHALYHVRLTHQVFHAADDFMFVRKPSER